MGYEETWRKWIARSRKSKKILETPRTGDQSSTIFFQALSRSDFCGESSKTAMIGRKTKETLNRETNAGGDLSKTFYPAFADSFH
jgi:hypothetical protein